GSKAFITKAHRYRKMMGGGMRQAGILAAAGIYALKNNVARLAEDHRHAAEVAQALTQKSWVEQVLPCETNIVIFFVADTATRDKVLQHLQNHSVKAMAFGPKSIRFVFHLEITSKDMESLVQVLELFH
ncbi:MAG TPA: beta-eliminating lyase-related protein, partial [Luteibaculaceae bacterium]|nr:beta-eliminating lyase-related protein [Luteibaculaceae bacterium]